MDRHDDLGDRLGRLSRRIVQVMDEDGGFVNLASGPSTHHVRAGGRRVTSSTRAAIASGNLYALA